MWEAAAMKLADHADDRLRERTTLPPEALAELRRKVRKVRGGLHPDHTYHYAWPGAGYAVIGPVGARKRHVVKTVLGPYMSPPGQPLPDYPPPISPMPDK